MTKRSLVGHILELLESVGSTRLPPDHVAREFFRARHYLGARDRRVIAEALYGVIRNWRLLQAYVGEAAASMGSRKPERTPSLAMYAAYALRVAHEAPQQLLADIEGPTKDILPDVNADALISVLGEVELPHIVTADPIRRLAVTFSLPDFVVGEWTARLGQTRAEHLCASLNRPAPLTIRVNTLVTTIEACQESLEQEGVKSARARWCPSGLVLERRINAQASESFRRGYFEIQDEGSQLIALLLDPQVGERVVDACAGGGGKTLHMAALMKDKGELLAVDVEQGRIKNMRERLRRAGVSIAQVCLAQRDTALLLHWELQADRVLVDAPCTGLGTSRRNPWFKLTLTEEDVLRMAHSQRAVLERYERLVKPGGRLVYATCTLLKKENEDIIDWFLNTYRDFSLVSAPDLLRAQGISVDSSRPFMTLYPSETGTDGFFAAVAVRNA